MTIDLSYFLFLGENHCTLVSIVDPNSVLIESFSLSLAARHVTHTLLRLLSNLGPLFLEVQCGMEEVVRKLEAALIPLPHYFLQTQNCHFLLVSAFLSPIAPLGPEKTDKHVSLLWMQREGLWTPLCDSGQISPFLRRALVSVLGLWF